MNNNRGNNRRRGRGSNNNSNRQQGGGQNVNRIDSRARGNAPQLHEKYRKLAHDAHLNGDRVQEEYYLQFADHYFRVMADQRVRQEEQRRPRDERWQEGGDNERERDDSEYGSEYGNDDGYTAYDQPHRREREERPPRRDDQQQQQQPREERESEARGDDTGDDNARDTGQPEGAQDDGSGQPPVYEPVENPFVRENRGTRGLRPRREDRGPRREPKSDSQPDNGADADDDAPAGLDPSMLPPAISAGREETAAEDVAEAKPRRRTRRPRPPADDTLEAVS